MLALVLSIARISLDSHIAHSMKWHAFVRFTHLVVSVAACLHRRSAQYLFVLQHKCHWHRLYVHQTHIIVCVAALWFVQSSYIVVNAEHFQLIICMCHRHIAMLDFTYFTIGHVRDKLFIYLFCKHPHNTNAIQRLCRPRYEYVNPINEQYAIFRKSF